MAASQLTKTSRSPPIAGWLILIAFDVVIEPLRQTALLLAIYIPMFQNGMWESLTTRNTEFYAPYWAPLIAADILIKGALVAASIYVAYLFFSKQSALPRWYGSVALAITVYLFFDAYLATVLIDGVSMLEAVVARGPTRPLSSLLIWTPYLWISLRAKETFIG
jgi:hypothetical protein